MPVEKLNIDYNLGRSSYNKFFGVASDDVMSCPLVKRLALLFNIEDKTRGIKVCLSDYSVSYGVFDWNIFVSKYLTYSAKLKLTFKISICDVEYTSSVVIPSVPLMVDDRFFMIHGTARIFVFQLSKIAGIYYQCDNFGRMNNAKLVSVSGSRIELRINHRDIIHVHINNSKKIILPDIFKLIDLEKIERYVRHYNSKISIKYFEKLPTLLKYCLLFGSIFEIEIDKDSVLIYCDESECEKYMFSKIQVVDYDKNNSCARVLLLNLAQCIVVDKTSVPIKYRRASFVIVKQGYVIGDSFKKAIINSSIKLKLMVIFFYRGHASVLRSFASTLDRSYADDQNDDVGEDTAVMEQGETLDEDSVFHDDDDESVDSDDLDDVDDDEDESKSSSSYDDACVDVSAGSKVNIEYGIDSFIRPILNEQFDIQYSNEVYDKLTEEDIVKFISYFAARSAVVGNKSVNYDYLCYKIVKRPEEFIYSIFARYSYKLKSDIKYLTVDKSGGVNISELFSGYGISNDIRKLFTSHQLSQFLDQTNPLSELSHRRRTALLNLGSIDKHQVSIEGRGINQTYYGRICPIETPEGPNIGLISSFAVYAQISDYGLIVVPYYKVSGGKRDDKTIEFLDAGADLEVRKVSYSQLGDLSNQKRCLQRYRGEVFYDDPKLAQYMDIDYNVMYSMSSSLLPCSHCNDAKRSLMGSNMLKQAVPLVVKEAPVVGTGMEKVIAAANGNVYFSGADTEERELILYSCSRFVVSAIFSKGCVIRLQIYDFPQCVKTNMKTCNSTTVHVKNSDLISHGDVIADNFAVCDGEIALGQNVLYCLLSLDGYGFEDSVVLSERITRDSIFESVHMNEFDVKAKELDSDISEMFTIDNPNDRVRTLSSLDSRGIIKCGSFVKPWSVLVSKVLPVAGTLSVEDHVLSIMFDKKASEFKDVSYRVAYDVSGTVVDVKYFNRGDSNNFSEFYETIISKYITAVCVIGKFILSIVAKCAGQELTDDIVSSLKIEIIGNDLTPFHDIVKSVKEYHSNCLSLMSAGDQEYTSWLVNYFGSFVSDIVHRVDQLMSANVSFNAESCVVEYVKIIIAERRQASVGDKFAGRHGNKGVASRILPIQDMPILEDGTPVDMVFNPLSIPNRLNIGQVLEGLLGLTSYTVSKKVKFFINAGDSKSARSMLKYYLNFKAIRNKVSVDDALKIIDKGGCIPLEAPAFGELTFDDVKEVMGIIDNNPNGRYRLRSGITGEPTNRLVQCGYSNIMKLNHMAVDKVTARETGRYNRNQQPLSRKVPASGQRFGEMEGWAAIAYGSSMFKVETFGPKSDDKDARNIMYANIQKRDYCTITKLSESTNLAVRYLNSSCIKMEFKRLINKASRTPRMRGN